MQQWKMDRNYHKGHMVGRSPRGLKEKPWIHDDLNVLQLDMFDRTVIKIAGKPISWICLSSPHFLLNTISRVDYLKNIARKTQLKFAYENNKLEHKKSFLNLNANSILHQTAKMHHMRSDLF